MRAQGGQVSKRLEGYNRRAANLMEVPNGSAQIVGESAGLEETR